MNNTLTHEKQDATMQLRLATEIILYEAMHYHWESTEETKIPVSELAARSGLPIPTLQQYLVNWISNGEAQPCKQVANTCDASYEYQGKRYSHIELV